MKTCSFSVGISDLIANRNTKQSVQQVLLNSKQKVQDLIHSIYMNELVFNINNQDSKIKLIEIISRLIEEEGIEGLILGGTELSLMFDQTDFDTIKILDTCLIHVDSIIVELV